MSIKKVWQSFHVDSNISDSWLVSLNQLKGFELISICEGHYLQDHPNEKQPHMNLRLKPMYLPHRMGYEWQTCREVIRASFDQSTIKDDIYIHASLSLEYSFPDCAISREVFGVEFSCERHRIQDQPEPWFEVWFQQAIELIEIIDTKIMSIFKHHADIA